MDSANSALGHIRILVAEFARRVGGFDRDTQVLEHNLDSATTYLPLKDYKLLSAKLKPIISFLEKSKHHDNDYVKSIVYHCKKIHETGEAYSEIKYQDLTVAVTLPKIWTASLIETFKLVTHEKET